MSLWLSVIRVNGFQLFMPVMVALGMMQILAGAALVYRSERYRAAALLTAGLLAGVRPLHIRCGVSCRWLKSWASAHGRSYATHPGRSAEPRFSFDPPGQCRVNGDGMVYPRGQSVPRAPESRCIYRRPASPQVAVMANRGSVARFDRCAYHHISESVPA